MKTRSLRSYVYLTGTFGLLVAIYAGLETVFAGLRSSCSINSYFSCSAVDASGKTTLFGIPDAAVGIAGFVAILVVAALAERNSRDLRFLYALAVVTTLGVATAGYFAYVEVAEIHALCPVCTAAYIFSVLVWIGALALTVKVRRRRERIGPAPTPATTT